MKWINQLTQTTRVSRCKYTGNPIIQELNTTYGYYSTAKRITEEEYKSLLDQTEYNGELHEAEIRFENSRHII